MEIQETASGVNEPLSELERGFYSQVLASPPMKPNDRPSPWEKYLFEQLQHLQQASKDLQEELQQTKQQLQNLEVQLTTKEVKEKANNQEDTVGPFVLTDKPGTEDVVLSRTVGSEKIEILCMLEKQYPEDEDEVEEQKHVIHMNVILSKADARLELDCSFVYGASEVMIEDVLFHESDTSLSTDGPEPNGGPIFEDLDEKLQQAFAEVLKARGLTTKVARYMMDHMLEKGQREYIGFLQRVHNFLTT